MAKVKEQQVVNVPKIDQKPKQTPKKNVNKVKPPSPKATPKTTVKKTSKKTVKKTPVKRKTASQKRNEVVNKIMDKKYPNIPNNVRKDVIYHMFLDRDKIGFVKYLPIEERVRIAIRSHILHAMTDFSSAYEDAKDELYDRTVGQVSEYDKYGRQYAYDEFYAEKARLYEDIRDDFEGEIDEQIQQWM